MRNQTVACEKENCAKHFATRKEMLKHLRKDHSESDEGLDTKDEVSPQVCQWYVHLRAAKRHTSSLDDGLTT